MPTFSIDVCVPLDRLGWSNLGTSIAVSSSFAFGTPRFSAVSQPALRAWLVWPALRALSARPARSSTPHPLTPF